MKKLFKYALIAGTGYAIHAAFAREAKLKSELYVGPTGPTLREKLVNTVGDHIGSKVTTFLFDDPVRPPHNSGSRHMRYVYRKSE